VKAVDFLKRLQGYYGAYQPVVLDEVKNWIIKNKPVLEELYTSLIESCTNQFKSPPDVATMSKTWKELRQRVPEHKALPEPEGEMVKIIWSDVWNEYRRTHGGVR